MRDVYDCRTPPETLRRALANIGEATSIAQCLRRESRALERERWTLAERDLIRLAAIARRQHLAYRNDSCTIVERLRHGRARACKS